MASIPIVYTHIRSNTRGRAISIYPIPTLLQSGKYGVDSGLDSNSRVVISHLWLWWAYFGPLLLLHYIRYFTVPMFYQKWRLFWKSTLLWSRKSTKTWTNLAYSGWSIYPSPVKVTKQKSQVWPQMVSDVCFKSDNQISGVFHFYS